MKILLIVPEFPPHHTGGGGVVFEKLAQTYQKQGHEVLVISGDHTVKNIFSSLNRVNEEGINVIRLPELYTPISLLNTVMPYPFWYNAALKNILTEYAPEFVHIHGYGLFMPAQLAKICRKLRLDYTFTIHGAPVSPEKMGNLVISIAYKFYHRFYGFPLLTGAKKLTAVSTFAKNFDVFRGYKDRIKVVGNGIDPNDFKQVNFDIFSKMNIRKKTQTKIILSLGRIEWIKGFEKVIEMIPDMLEKGYDVVYCIAGRDNGYKNHLQNLAKRLGVSNRICYLGFIDKAEKDSALQHADVIAIPSETETYGIVALEARIFKKPILTSFAGGLRDALDGYNSAFELIDFEKAFNQKNITDKSIADFYWDKIAKQYLGG